MKKLYLLTILSFLLAACVDEDIVKRQAVAEGLTFSVEVPGMVQTRALGKNPTEEVLMEHMRLFVFGEDGYFIGHYEATMSDFEEGAEGTATARFNVPTLKKTNDMRIVHFVAGDLDAGFSDLLSTDTEQSAMEKLTVSGNNDAYWQRQVFPDGFMPENENSNVITLQDKVKLIRNFCEVRMKEGVLGASYGIEGTGKTVTIESFAVVNALSTGYIAPYNPKQNNFVDYIGYLSELGDRRPYKAFYEYTKMYDGFKVDDKTLTTVVPQAGDYGQEAKYIYARNQNLSKKQAYLLLKAKVMEGANETVCYYKLDFSAKDPDNNVVSVMNLYNNFTYTFKITKINGEGYEKPEDAMNAAAANNISSSIEVSETPNISDGRGNSLSVESLNMMITTEGEHTMTYEYREDGTPTTTGVQAVRYPENKGLIKAEIRGNNIVFTTLKELPSDLQTQYVIITTPSGLSRRITVNVRKPFEFLDTRCQKLVKSTAGSGLSCIVALPPNLPISLFPLEIDIQPDQKVIYPDAELNKLPVGTIDIKEFHYKVAVSYNEYRLNNFVNCFFKTNQTLPEGTKVGIDVLCKNFVDSKMTFESSAKGASTFTDVKFTSDEAGSNDCTENVPFAAKTKVYLHFRLSEAVPTGTTIYFFSNYLENAVIKKGGGTITTGRATQFIFDPGANNVGPFTIEFETAHDVVGESLEMTSSDMDFVPYLLPYRNEAATVACFLNEEQQLQNGAVISIYNDEYYTEKVTDLVIGGADGEYNDNLLHMLSFATYDKEDIVYFQYTNNSVSPVTFHYAQASAGKLIEAAEDGNPYQLTFTNNK